MEQIKINLAEANNYLNERLKKLVSTLTVIATVLNSDPFKEAVLNFMIGDKKTFFYRKTITGRWIDQPHLNTEVYDIIMAGTKIEGNAASNSMDLYLTLLNGSDGDVIGYGNPGQKEIFTYSTMFDGMSIAELCNHYTHEWCHKLGFSHSFHRNMHRKYSVPYAIGDIVEGLAEKIQKTI